jgi:Cu/Ag efflux pump CusA
VRRAAGVLVAGIEAGSLFQEQKVFQVVVWGTPQTRYSLSSIRDLLIDTPSGGQVRLGEVADVRIMPTTNLIQHEAVSRYINVGLNVRGRDPNAVVSDIQQRLSKIQFPLEYRAAVLGAYQEQQADQRNLLIFGLASTIGIYLLLQAAFGSWRLATLAFFTLPSALLGGVLAAFAAGSVISLASLMGLLAVFGIAVRNIIVLIKRYQYLERHEGTPFGLDLVVQGARERCAPLLMTTLAVGLALLPLVISGNIAGQEIASPVAIVILGGLVTSTLLSLFIVPSLYLRFGSKKADSKSKTIRMEPDAAQLDGMRSNGAQSVAIPEPDTIRRKPDAAQ